MTEDTTTRPENPGTEGFWTDIDRAYDADFRHHTRMAKLNQQSVSFALQTFQSQMLGLMLLGESEKVLVPAPHDVATEETTAAQGAADTNP